MKRFFLKISAPIFLIFFTSNVLAASSPTDTTSGGQPTPYTSGGQPISGPGLTDPLQGKTFTALIESIIGYLIKIGAPILVLMVLYGGFLILTAREEPKKVEDGKKVILYAVIGYAIIICAWGVIYIIQDVLGAQNLVP